MDVAHSRMERLLGLITLLLNAKSPVSFRELRETMPEYAQGSEDAANRRFERDKASLIEDLGVPVRYIERDPDDDVPSGYIIDRDAYYLPKLALSVDELTALYVAGSAARAMEGFPWEAEVTRALEKIRFISNEDEDELSPVTSRVVVRPQKVGGDRVGRHFALLRDAISRRKTVRLVYRGLYSDEETVREVDPYGLFLREGVWCLHGFCRLREDRRTFHIDRIVSAKANEKAPRKPDFEPPEDLDLAALARLRPWSFPIEPPLKVRVLLEQRLAFHASALFGEEAEVEKQPDERAVVSLEVRSSEAFIEHVLGLGDGATILEPRELREAIVAHIDGVIEKYSEPGKHEEDER